MAAINGTVSRLKIGGTALAKETESTLSINVNNFEITSKDSGGWRELLPGLRDWSISGEGVLDFVAATGWDTLSAAALARTPLTILFTTAVTGDTEYTGSAYIETLEQGTPMEDKITFTFTLAGTGVLTAATV